MLHLSISVDPLVWLLGVDVSLLKDQAIATIRAGALDSEFYVAQESLGEIIACSVWMPPGQEMFSTYDLGLLGMQKL